MTRTQKYFGVIKIWQDKDTFLRTVPLIAVLFMFFLAINATAQKLETTARYGEVGRAIKIDLVDTIQSDLVNFELLAEYRPNSETSFTRKVENLIQPGKWSYTPRIAGLVLLRAVAVNDTNQNNVPRTIASMNLSVCYSTPPVQGIFVMLFAGIILFGGIIVSVRQAMISKKNTSPIIDT